MNSPSRCGLLGKGWTSDKTGIVSLAYVLARS